MRARNGSASDDRLAEIHEQLVEAVAKLVTSDAWARMLTVAARFPTYSPSNLLLIATQRPDATRVAGIRTWNSIGRRVVKGEHGIAILAPCIYKRSDDETPRDDDPQRARDTEDSRRQLRGFKVVHVFDIDQTEGESIPADGSPELLTGEAPAHLWEHLAALVHDDGYTLERGPCPPEVNGYTDFTNQRVRVRDDADPAQAVKTLAHELAHIRADHASRFPAYAAERACRGQAEIEAESIAYIVMAHAGLAADPYSVPYLAGWADGDVERIRGCLSRVVTTARHMIDAQDATPGEQRREVGSRHVVVGRGALKRAVPGEQR
ncbi:ArdC-like ssDNA-binding domain-containing protein [Cellulomonas sp.]|uniref:ArdC-like ssDNA-binding domain-containing protein n=1 Tax=Cellulomonas sp. TaxID=40001 RepID=UPI003BA999EE